MQFEFALNLLTIFQAVTFLLMLGTLIGAIDEWRHASSTWKDIFTTLIALTTVALLLQMTLYGIQSLGEKETVTIKMALLIFSWGFRIIALVSLLRVLWPAKYWFSAERLPQYPRAKLLVYCLLVFGLSFIPSLLNIQ